MRLAGPLALMLLGAAVLAAACDASPELPPGTVLLVDGQPVTAEDLRIITEASRLNVEWMREEGVRLAELAGDDRASYIALADFLEASGFDTIALAVLVQKQSFYAEALERGHEPTQAEVDEYVSDQRGLYEAAVADGADDSIAWRQITLARSEAGYWTERAPRLARRVLASDAFTEQLRRSGEVESSEDLGNYQMSLAEDASIEIVDESAISEQDVEAAIGYFDAFRQWSEQHAVQHRPLQRGARPCALRPFGLLEASRPLLARSPERSAGRSVAR